MSCLRPEVVGPPLTSFLRNEKSVSETSNREGVTGTLRDRRLPFRYTGVHTDRSSLLFVDLGSPYSRYTRTVYPLRPLLWCQVPSLSGHTERGGTIGSTFTSLRRGPLPERRNLRHLRRRLSITKRLGYTELYRSF